MLGSTLIAGARLSEKKYVAKAIEYLKGAEGELCAQATFALGRIEYSQESSQVEKAVKSLRNLEKVTDDDRLLGIIVTSIFNIFLQRKSQKRT